jgi:hypothetical protein
MTDFFHKPSKAYLDAVDALKRLPLEERGRAYADASFDDWQAIAEKLYGKRTSGKKSWRRLTGVRGDISDKLPGDDHIELRVGKSLSYISQPYQLNLNQLREIVEICNANKLDVSIDARSWYFPGSTICVTYQRQASGDLVANDDCVSVKASV